MSALGLAWPPARAALTTPNLSLYLHASSNGAMRVSLKQVLWEDVWAILMARSEPWVGCLAFNLAGAAHSLGGAGAKVREAGITPHAKELEHALIVRTLKGVVAVDPYLSGHHLLLLRCHCVVRKVSEPLAAIAPGVPVSTCGVVNCRCVRVFSSTAGMSTTFAVVI